MCMANDAPVIPFGPPICCNRPMIYRQYDHAYYCPTCHKQVRQ